MRVVNRYYVSYIQKTPEKSLQTAEREKRCKYMGACLQKFHHLQPFIISVDGRMIIEAEATLKFLTRQLAAKWRQPYSPTCVYIWSRVAITMMCATHRCIWGSHVPVS